MLLYTQQHFFCPSHRSSFAKADRAHFDLAKLLDPFEKLEREFNWEDVTTLRPPSAFGTSHCEDSARRSVLVKRLFMGVPFWKLFFRGISQKLGIKIPFQRKNVQRNRLQELYS
jgi:hypothetical protein